MVQTDVGSAEGACSVALRPTLWLRSAGPPCAPEARALPLRRGHTLQGRRAAPRLRGHPLALPLARAVGLRRRQHRGPPAEPVEDGSQRGSRLVEQARDISSCSRAVGQCKKTVPERWTSRAWTSRAAPRVVGKCKTCTRTLDNTETGTALRPRIRSARPAHLVPAQLVPAQLVPARLLRRGEELGEGARDHRPAPEHLEVHKLRNLGRPQIQ